MTSLSANAITTKAKANVWPAGLEGLSRACA